MIHRICKISDIPDNGWKLFVINSIEVLVGRRNGALFAFNNCCPHKGASLAKGEFNADNIVCHMHGYEYNVFTGNLENMKSWKRDDAWVEQTDAWRRSGNLTLYPVTDDNGTICVDLAESSKC